MKPRGHALISPFGVVGGYLDSKAHKRCFLLFLLYILAIIYYIFINIVVILLYNYV